MNSAEHLLSCLSEECSEITAECVDLISACSKTAVRVSKAQRFGLSEIQPGQLLSNAERISLELADLLALAEVLESAGLITRTQVEAKKVKLVKFMGLAREVGTLTEEKPVPTVTLKEAASELAKRYRDDRRITSIGIGSDSIVVFVDHTKLPAVELPSEWKGWPVRVVNSGPMAVMGGDPNAS